MPSVNKISQRLIWFAFVVKVQGHSFAHVNFVKRPIPMHMMSEEDAVAQMLASAAAEKDEPLTTSALGLEEDDDEDEFEVYRQGLLLLES